MISAEDIALALCGATPNGDGWTACCPAHDDRDPSLSIRDGADGRVLVHCHAGCSQDKVIASEVLHGKFWRAGGKIGADDRQCRRRQFTAMRRHPGVKIARKLPQAAEQAACAQVAGDHPDFYVVCTGRLQLVDPPGRLCPRKHPQPPQDPPSNEAVFAALAAAAAAGAAFRLSGNRVEISGLEKVEQGDPAIAAFLREYREAIFAALDGNAADAPSLALIEALGVEIAYCADDSTAAAAIAEVLADAGGRPIAIDVETAALPEYADYPPMRLTIAGRPNKVQPRSDNHAALDPHLSEIRLVQLYGGGQRVAIFEITRRRPWERRGKCLDHRFLEYDGGFLGLVLRHLGQQLVVNLRDQYARHPLVNRLASRMGSGCANSP